MADNLPDRPDSDPVLPTNPDDVSMPGNGGAPPDVLLPEEEEASFDLRRYLSAVLRYKWLVLLVLIVGACAGVLVARWTPPEYQAQTTLWIETSERGDGGRGPIQTGQLFSAYSWVNLLKSYTVLDSVVNELGLYIHTNPAYAGLFANFKLRERFAPGEYQLSIDSTAETFTLKLADGRTLQSGATGDSIGSELGFAWAPEAERMPAGQTIDFAVAVPRDISRQLTQRLGTRMDLNGNFLEIQLRGSRPKRIAAILNSVATRFVNVAAQLKGAKLEELTKILSEQLRYSQQRLQDATVALETFRVNTITLPSERATPLAPGINMTRDPVLANFFQMKVKREELRLDIEAIQRALSAARDSAVPVAALEAVTSVKAAPLLNQALNDLVMKRAELRALLNRYTTRHPPVQDVIEAIAKLEGETIPALANGLLDELAVREAELVERIEAAGYELEEIPTRSIEEAGLERRVETASALYLNLRQRYETARLASASSIPDVRVLDQAVAPRQPVSNSDPRIILIAILGSLGAGLLGAILLDRMDSRVRYPDQITHGLGLPILGTVPRVRDGSGRAAADSAVQVVEAFRTLRLSIVHAHGTAGPVVVSISSPGQGDGKSVVSSNLAVAFADLGQRTLLIDGDTRRGSAHRLLGRDRLPGLTDFLDGDSSREKIIQRTDHKTLDLIGSGTRKNTGPELLSSPEMRQLLLELRSDYGVIIVDSPPLAAGVDAFLLGTLAGNMLLVLRNGSTDRMLAEAKLDLLDRMPVRVLGAVLNDVPDSGVYRYYSYLPEYAATDEPAGALPGTAVPG